MFRNLDRQPFAVPSEPLWQREVMERVNAEFAAEADEVNRDFHARVVEALSSSAPEEAANVVHSLMRETQRYVFLKRVPDPDGVEYDVQVDLLLRHVSFCEI